MKFLKSKALLFILFSLMSFNLLAESYHYKADVKGMVCAFCAYSVSKNISKLPGVDADTVDVDLKGGHVDFISSQQVDTKKLAALFSDSGFTISNVTFKKTRSAQAVSHKEPSLDMAIDVFKADQFSGVLEAIGNLAASTSASIMIQAPASMEDTLLKPLLMGRQQVIKVRFLPAESEQIHLQLFD